MHDAMLVRILQRVGRLARDPHCISNRKLSLALETTPQRFSFHVRHYVVEQPSGAARIEQRQYVRVLQARRRPDLDEEPLRPQHGGELRAQDFYRHLPPVPYVVREINRRHAARAELALDRVAVRERAAQRVERIGGGCHRGSNVRFSGWCGNRTVVTSSGPTRLQARSVSWSCRDTQINSVRAK